MCCLIMQIYIAVINSGHLYLQLSFGKFCQRIPAKKKKKKKEMSISYSNVFEIVH